MVGSAPYRNPTMKRSVPLNRHALLATKVAVVLTVTLMGVSTACGKGEGAAENPPSNHSGATEGNGQPDKPVPKARPRGPERSVYSLIDNRLSAHVQRAGGIVAVGGSAGFVKYLRYGKSKLPWKIRQTRDGKEVAVMGGKTAAVQIPLTAAQVQGAKLRMRVHNGNARALTIRVNGKQKKEVTQQMTAGWSTVTVDIPDGLLKEGENHILIFTGKGEPMALSWLQLGGAEPGEDAPSVYDSGKKGLVLPAKGGLAYYVMGPEKGLLAGDIADAGCSVAVTATGHDGTVVKGALVGQGSAVELGKLAGQPIHLQLAGQGCPVAYLQNAALKVPGKEPTAKRGSAPKYVILWIMDSLRADRVRAFNPKARPETPNFDKLAKTGAAFRQAYVQGNESRVSHASIWSSLYPVKHNMISSKAKLAGKWKTIDEVARSAGMYTSGVSANGYVAKKWGFGAAWNKYSNHIHERLGLKGKDVYDKAIGTIDGKKDPWFLYLGTIDTHVSWRPKKPWIEKYHPEPYSGRFAKRFSGEDAGKKLTLTAAEIEWVRAIYDSNVSYQDELLGQFLAKLDEWGIAEQTMIIITADHGDEQWEDGNRVGHGASLRDSLVHVPLLVHYPPMIPGGVVEEGADVIDIVPTLADALGQKFDPEWQGRSLIPVANGIGAGYPRVSMASMYERAHVVRMGPWKLRAQGGATPRVYNLDQDPDEKRDIVKKSPIARRVLADPLWMLRAFNRDWRKSEWGDPANVTGAFPAQFGE